MKKHAFKLVIALLFFVSCQSNEVNSANQLAEITKAMAQQEDAWNAGDLPGFMASYWRNDSLVFIGKKGLSYGWNTTLANYQKSYPNKVAMGKLSFNNLELEQLDSKHAYVIGKWTLYRVNDTLAGHYSLLWEKQAGKWLIKADHSS